jgi:hypothetical protein
MTRAEHLMAVLEEGAGRQLERTIRALETGSRPDIQRLADVGACIWVLRRLLKEGLGP